LSNTSESYSFKNLLDSSKLRSPSSIIL